MRPASSQRFRSKHFLAAVAALVLALLLPAPALALVCTQADLDSKNAEKCAKKYAARLRACLKKGIPQAICDTSPSDKFCDQLSAECTITQEIDALIVTIYGAEPRSGTPLTCTPEDLDSKNAEKCAKKYTRAVRKCLKKGIPLTSCDTSNSDQFCTQLSAACTVLQETQPLISVVYGADGRRYCLGSGGKRKKASSSGELSKTRTLLGAGG